MSMFTSNRFKQRCPRCARMQHVHNEIRTQPLVTAIPALLNLSKQILNDSVGLVLDPWSWRARLIGAPSTLLKDEDGRSRPEPTRKVYQSDSPPPTKRELDSQSDLRQQGPRPVSKAASESKSGKKTVHFVEPECKPNLRSRADSPTMPTDRTKLELYEVVSTADDPPRVIDVNYDTKTNRWCIDESLTFPDREDTVAMICSKSVLRAMKHNVSIAGNLAPANSTTEPQFQVNRLPDYAVIQTPNDDLAVIKASSHDLYHIGDLEEFLLHAHQDPQRVISASGGQYMKHWLIDLRQLVTMLGKSDTGRECESAFWKLFHRGFVEKVTLQLWGAGDAEPEQSADIENLDWVTWVRVYKKMIPNALRKDLDRALVFLLSGPISESRWRPFLHPNISIMSHKGITSGLATQTKVANGTEPPNVVSSSPCSLIDPVLPGEVGKAGSNGTSTSMRLRSVQKDDGQVKPWVPSAKDPRPPLQTHHLIHTPSPRTYPHPMEPPLPDAVVAPLLASQASKLRRGRLSGPSNHRQLSEPPVPNHHVRGSRKLSDIESPYSATSVPVSGLSSPTLASDESAARSDSTGKIVFSEEDAVMTHGQVPAKMDYGRETGGLIEPSGSSTNTSRGVRLDEKRAAARMERALRGPKAGTSAHQRDPFNLEDPDLTESRKRAVEIRERMMKSWASAISQHGRTSDNAEPPTLNIDATGVSNEVPEFSYQFDEVLAAEQRLATSDSAIEQGLEKPREHWMNEIDRIRAESELKSILREELDEEWAHLDGIYEGPWSVGAHTTDVVKDSLSQFKMDTRLAQLEGLSDKRRNQPLGRYGVLDHNGDVVKSEMGLCKLQLKMANEAVMHLKNMLDVANKEATEAKGGQESTTRELNEMKMELAQLKASLQAHAAGDESLTDMSRTINRPQALCENSPRKRCSEESEHGVPQLVTVESTKGRPNNAQEQSRSTSPTSSDGHAVSRLSTLPRPNGGVNDLGAECQETSPTLDCQSPLKSAAAHLCDDPNAVPSTWMANGFDHDVVSVGPPAGDNDQDASQVNGKVHDKVSSSNDTVGDQASSQTDSELSAETIKFAETDSTQMVVEGQLPIGIAHNDVPVNGATNKHQHLPNGIAVAGPELPEDIVNDILDVGPRNLDTNALVAGFEDMPNESSVQDSGKATDLPLRGLSSAPRQKKKPRNAIRTRTPAKSASDSVLSRDLSPI